MRTLGDPASVTSLVRDRMGTLEPDLPLFNTQTITQEIGLRVALGAQARQVLWLILRRALMQLAIGLPTSIAGAFGVGRLLQSLLVQTSPADPLTLILIVAILVATAVLACLRPARRATHLDPMLPLRYE